MPNIYIVNSVSTDNIPSMLLPQIHWETEFHQGTFTTEFFTAKDILVDINHPEREELLRLFVPKYEFDQYEFKTLNKHVLWKAQPGDLIYVIKYNHERSFDTDTNRRLPLSQQRRENITMIFKTKVSKP